MRRLLVTAILIAFGTAASGCGGSYSAIRTAHPPLGHRKFETREAAYQFTRGRIIEIVAVRQWTLPGGEAVPDYEYLYVSVPDTAGTYQVGDAGVVVRRLVRSQREEFLYEASSGSVKYRFAWLTKDHVEARFDVMTEQAWPAPAEKQLWALSGRIKANESVRDAQGMINKYQDTIERLRAQASAEPAGAASNER